MKLVAFMLLALIGFTADAAFTLGVLGEAVNLANARPKPEASTYIFVDIVAILYLFFAIIHRVRRLIREAAMRAAASRQSG